MCIRDGDPQTMKPSQDMCGASACHAVIIVWCGTAPFAVEPFEDFQTLRILRPLHSVLEAVWVQGSRRLLRLHPTQHWQVKTPRCCNGCIVPGAWRVPQAQPFDDGHVRMAGCCCCAGPIQGAGGILCTHPLKHVELTVLGRCCCAGRAPGAWRVLTP